MTQDPTDVDLQHADAVSTTAADHVLESAVEVWQEYNQYYDPKQEAVVLGPATIDDKMDPFTQYDCTCGETFYDQRDALRHLLANTPDA